MPLWNVYCPEGAYTAEDKQAFAERVTGMYTEWGIPRFYVSVVFQETPRESFYIGGEPTDDFVRIWVHEIARRVPEGAEGWWMKRIRETVVDPFVHGRRLRSEIHIATTPRELWSINGLRPPNENTDEEKRWAAENTPSASPAPRGS
jgi:phenylpyruvate tautomerase PptA (4-oxalocrotonate tautomerase family)